MTCLATIIWDGSGRVILQGLAPSWFNSGDRRADCCKNTRSCSFWPGKKETRFSARVETVQGHPRISSSLIDILLTFFALPEPNYISGLWLSANLRWKLFFISWPQDTSQGRSTSFEALAEVLQLCLLSCWAINSISSTWFASTWQQKEATPVPVEINQVNITLHNRREGDREKSK